MDALPRKLERMLSANNHRGSQRPGHVASSPKYSGPHSSDWQSPSAHAGQRRACEVLAFIMKLRMPGTRDNSTTSSFMSQETLEIPCEI